MCLATVPTLALGARGEPPVAHRAPRHHQVALPAPLSGSGVFGKPADPAALQCIDSEVLYCFQGELTALVNPGCFSVPSAGDCASSDSHYMVQYFDPLEYLGDFPGTWRVCEVAWVTNDGDTVWPSVGVVRVPYTAGRFPTTMELESLQVQNVASPGDTAEVVVNLQGANIEFTRDDVLYLALQFPEGGVLTAPLQGPGILAADVPPGDTDANCDFFTVDSGTQWYAPEAACDTCQPPVTGLDWGFALVIEPVTAVEERSWSLIKQLYRSGKVTLKP
jgi:hypothetical protein